jgi:hypothetical protein
MSDKFIVNLAGTAGLAYDWDRGWDNYFRNFYEHCEKIASRGDGESPWRVTTVMNNKLRPLGGKIIQTKTQGWYLRWDNEASHTAFLLRWA